MTVPGFVISAPQGRSGKTTVSLGLCAALARRGLAVQPFKKGPDYIDPSWLSAAAGRACRNLDLFMMPQEALVALYYRALAGAQVAVVEGAMGLFDGVDLAGSGSTAQLARALGLPIILVVNATRMTRSAAAMVSGYQHFEPDLDVAGVIFNNVAGGRHESMLVHAVAEHCGLPVLGCLPKDEGLSIPERHLGLVPQGEAEVLQAKIERAERLVSAHVDVEATLLLARPATAPRPAREPAGQPSGPSVRVGVIRDRAFSFYYPENLEALERAGAELVFIDALGERSLPEVAALYIGGGFPEMFAAELEANAALRHDLAQAVATGLPVYAECAGLIYLSRRLHWQGRSYEMVGALPCEVSFTAKPQGHGYVAATVVEANPFFPEGQVLRGHEFHYGRLEALGQENLAYRLERGHGIGQKRDAIIYRNVLAGFTHLHAVGTPEWAGRLVAVARSAAKDGGLAAGAARSVSVW
ncbi:MAG: cobyrinate a,c-diamide synthase [Chloroflexi bacterium]|nr:cobyrinate a,c-diamide synthase [Chloroflexota bacterium]MCL5107454.1 cobyrinate a,c-diamide synthase [Chloroflexota bacterium]